jgi:parvulin-like peptidyl-prolyl isomerase
MLKWYQEPLIHFLVLGTLLFFLTQFNTFSMMNGNSKKIIIREDEIQQFITFWNKKNLKNPTQKDIDSFLKIYIEKEILYTEALQMKLNQNDKTIKQLLIDKLKYIVSDPMDTNDISDEELQNFFNKNKYLFSNKTSTIFTFRHIYFNPKHSDNLDDRVKTIYIKIKDQDFNQTYISYGDKFYKGSYFSNISQKGLSNIFSHAFTQEIQKLPQKKWSEPISSGYGIHLIYIEEIHHTEILFETMKEKIRNKYIIHKSKEKYNDFYNTLKEKYQVIIEPYILKNEQ